MRNFFVLLISTMFVLFSCEERNNTFEELNEPPKLLFYDEANTLVEVDTYTDSIKLSKGVSNEYVIKLHVKDDFNDWQLEHSANSGAFVQTSLNDSTVLLSYFPESAGYHDINISVHDNMGKRKELKLSLFAFQNLLPVAKLSITENQEGDFVFDGSASYDTDQRFGGKVVRYKFSIGGEKLILTENTMKFYIDRKGVYEVGLTVVDNDNTVSEIVKAELIIE